MEKLRGKRRYKDKGEVLAELKNPPWWHISTNKSNSFNSTKESFNTDRRTGQVEIDGICF